MQKWEVDMGLLSRDYGNKFYQSLVSEPDPRTRTIGLVPRLISLLHFLCTTLKDADIETAPVSCK